MAKYEASSQALFHGVTQQICLAVLIWLREENHTASQAGALGKYQTDQGMK